MRTLTSQKKAIEDWHKADIIAALKKQGWSVRQLSLAHGLSQSTVRAALERPYPKCERIIADALGLTPADIWPEREAKRNFKPILKKL